MKVVRELRGNQASHVCPYHQWCYDAAGRLTGVPLQRGEKGIEGSGMPKDFSKESHGMRRLRVATLHGVVFGTLSDATPPLSEYLGDAVCERLARMLSRPLRISGYQRHTLKTNWKLFAENSRDAYHAPMLHPFLSTFGLINPNDHGRSQVSQQGFHSIISIYNDAEGAKTVRGKPIPAGKVSLEDMSLMQGFKEHEDGLSLNIVSIFPSTLFTCVGNTWSVRQIRPKSPGVVELLYTHFGFRDDSPEQREMRRKQGNLVGPAGYVSIEDVEALELLQSGIAKGEDKSWSTIEMGGRTVGNQEHVVTEVGVRGLWKGYCEIMGFEPAPDSI
jgi:anthranilate 1,2-dioxygenase large subunit